MYTRLGEHALRLLAGRPPPVRLSERMRAALQTREGAPRVVFGTHTAHWEAALVAMACELPLTVIVKRQSQGWAERLVTARRLSADLELLHPAGSLRAACAALARGRVVVALGDQAPSARAGVLDRFMNRACLTDKTPALLAAVAGCPLWVVAQSCVPSTGEILVDLLGSLTPHAPRDAWILHATRHATARLEAHVRAHPADWLWLHRRWRTRDR